MEAKGIGTSATRAERRHRNAQVLLNVVLHGEPQIKT
jgi:hypothetical protein